MNILIAEDDPIFCKLLSRLLEKLGYEVTVAEDGQQAWQAFQDQPCPLVITDWMMPHMDGIELVKKIRQLKGGKYTYVIMVTANVGDSQNYAHAMDAGVDDFIAKPVDQMELEMRLRVAKRILKANSKINSLTSMLTICAYTKKIKFPKEGWQPIEQFMQNHLGITLSHGIDPDHYEKVIKPQLEELNRNHENDAE